MFSDHRQPPRGRAPTRRSVRPAGRGPAPTMAIGRGEGGEGTPAPPLAHTRPHGTGQGPDAAHRGREVPKGVRAPPDGRPSSRSSLATVCTSGDGGPPATLLPLAWQGPATTPSRAPRPRDPPPVHLPTTISSPPQKPQTKRARVLRIHHRSSSQTARGLAGGGKEVDGRRKGEETENRAIER